MIVILRKKVKPFFITDRPILIDVSNKTLTELYNKALVIWTQIFVYMKINKQLSSTFITRHFGKIQLVDILEISSDVWQKPGDEVG